MPLFKKNSNDNSANRRRRRAQLLLNNKLLVNQLETALFAHWRNSRKEGTNSVIRLIKGKPNKWTPNLVPRLNMMLMKKLHQAYNNIQPELKKRNNNAVAARTAARQARQANERRKANQHAAYLLTNEGKQWKRQNNEKRRLQKQRNNENARRRENARANMYARTGYNMSNFGGSSVW